jgi:hypothetical protein
MERTPREFDIMPCKKKILAEFGQRKKIRMITTPFRTIGGTKRIKQ